MTTVLSETGVSHLSIWPIVPLHHATILRLTILRLTFTVLLLINVEAVTCEALISKLTTRPKAELLMIIKAEAAGRSLNARLTSRPSR